MQHEGQTWAGFEFQALLACRELKFRGAQQPGHAARCLLALGHAVWPAGMAGDAGGACVRFAGLAATAAVGRVAAQLGVDYYKSIRKPPMWAPHWPVNGFAADIQWGNEVLIALAVMAGR